MQTSDYLILLCGISLLLVGNCPCSAFCIAATTTRKEVARRLELSLLAARKRRGSKTTSSSSSSSSSSNQQRQRSGTKAGARRGNSNNNNRKPQKKSTSGSGSSRNSKNKNNKRPRLVIFDLDGCLWTPELFELQINNRNDGPSPFFDQDPHDVVPGTRLLQCTTTHNNNKLPQQPQAVVQLLGDTRRILHELYTHEAWYPTRVGIASRTHPAAWAHDLLQQFVIYNPTKVAVAAVEMVNEDVTARSSNDLLTCCSMKDIFDPALCILDKDMDKATQFQLLLERANQSGSDAAFPSNNNNNHKKQQQSTKHKRRIQYKDMLFFDNEAGNCKQVAALGVTCVYTPKGLTYAAWQNGLAHFPSPLRVLGPKLPY